nr:MAG TPA: hypothetical protein [Caudoviricetes sp.]DAN01967.1 MAG TPA: hypothetical protein [Caudoviricetes sp.]
MTSCYIEHKKSIRLRKKKGETNEYQNIYVKTHRGTN